MEVLVAIMIMGLIVGLGYSIYFFTHDTFGAGSDRSHMQKSIRIVDAVLRRELRNVVELSLANGNALSIEKDGDVYSLRKNDSRVGEIGSGESDIFIQVIPEGDKYILEYEIISKIRSTRSSEQTYVFGNSILLNNIHHSDDFDNTLETGIWLGQNPVYYKHPVYGLDEGE